MQRTNRRRQGIGSFTFVGPTGNSVIDLIICSKEVLHLTESFKVEERTESSHFPVSMSLQCYINSAVLKKCITSVAPDKTIFNFSIENTEEFRNNLASLLTNAYIHSFTLRVEDKAESINVLTDAHVSMLKACGQCCKHQIRKLKTEQEKWFDSVCKTLKAEKYRLLRQYRQVNNDDNL